MHVEGVLSLHLIDLWKQDCQTAIIAQLPYCCRSSQIATWIDAGLCPRCVELEKHLRYWRERSWFKKARDLRWENVWARRQEIPVNVSSFSGVLKMADEVESAGSMLGTKR